MGLEHKDIKLFQAFRRGTAYATLCALIVFFIALAIESPEAQVITLGFVFLYALGLLFTRPNLFLLIRIYITVAAPIAFAVTVLLVGGYLSQSLAMATCICIGFMTLQNFKKLRIGIIIINMVLFVLSSLYLKTHAPIWGEVYIPFAEIVVFFGCLIWLFLIFNVYDENKTRSYTEALELKNKNLRAKEVHLEKARNNLAVQNKKLSVLNRELKLKNKQIKEFTFIVTHDLKAPLNHITTIAEELQEFVTDNMNSNANLYIDYLRKTSKRMGKLVHGLLDYAKIGTREKLSKVDSKQLVEKVIEDLGDVIKKRNAKIVLGELPVLYAYEMELRMLMQNLIDNALKFTSDQQQPEIQIHSEKKEGHFLFSMRDNGVGIPVGETANIFELFHKAHAQKKYEGTGIGLYGCKRIAEIHEGKIWVKSEENKGSIFYFTIKSDLNNI